MQVAERLRKGCQPVSNDVEGCERRQVAERLWQGARSGDRFACPIASNKLKKNYDETTLLKIIAIEHREVIPYEL